MTIRAGGVKGLFTAMITPFDSAGRVDEDAIFDLVKFQVKSGTEGLFPCGSTGLGPLLTLEERRRIAQTVVGAAAGKVPVVVQVGSADTESTAALARHAESVGAAAVASLTPYYYKPGEAAIVKHFERVASSIDIPLFAYNIPPFTGNNLRPQTVAGMAKKGTLAGVKDSSRDFLQLVDLLDVVPEDFVVMNGTEEYALFAIMSGAKGLVSGGASAFPELFANLVVSEREGRLEDALGAQKKVRMVKEVVKESPIAWYYEALRRRGVDCGRPRAPMLGIEPGPAAVGAKRLKALGLLAD